METKFTGCTISGGVNSYSGNNNRYISGNETNYAYIGNYENFTKYLDEVTINSNNAKERECAIKAKTLYNNNKRKELKKLIIENIGTFTAGTFATTAGGLLLNIIQDILK